MTTTTTTRSDNPRVSIDTATVLRLLADYAESNCSPEDLRSLETLKARLAVIGKDFDYIAELVTATAEGRVILCKHCEGKVCGNCSHFLRFSGVKEGFSGSDNAYATGVCELHVARNEACGSTSLPKRFTNTSRGCRKFEARGEEPIRYCKEALPCSAMR